MSEGAHPYRAGDAARQRDSAQQVDNAEHQRDADHRLELVHIAQRRPGCVEESLNLLCQW